jgi:predicted nucleic acid-binding protein
MEDETIDLVGDELLLEKLGRYAELLKSPTTTGIVAALIHKTSLVRVSSKYRSICKTYIKTPDKADILHAAACLQTDAVLVTNDRHFRRITKEHIIDLWSISEAIRKLL